MKIFINQEMKNYSNMRVGGKAKKLIILETKEEIVDVYNDKENTNIFILGNGTNVLFDKDLENGYGNKTKRVRIIDDYAHHPTEIKATLKAIKSIDTSRLVAIFQPHRYSRVHFLLDEFKDAFKDVDKVILLPIYAAGEKNEFNISSEILKEHINHNNIEVMTEWKDIKRYVSRVKKDSTYIFMGAGDISTLAHEIAEELEGMSE